LNEDSSQNQGGTTGQENDASIDKDEMHAKEFVKR